MNERMRYILRGATSLKMEDHTSSGHQEMQVPTKRPLALRIHPLLLFFPLPRDIRILSPTNAQ